MPLTFKGKTSSAEKSSIENAYCESVSRKRLMLIVCTISVFVTYIISLGMGSVKIPVEESMKIFINMIAPDTYPDVSPIYTTIITKDRIYKSALCIIAGIGLGISGAMMQGILRNPLVSPFTLGISSAASFGAALGIVLVPSFFGTTSVLYEFLGMQITASQIMRMVFAFIVGVLSVGLVILMSNRNHVTKSTIILAGVILSYLFQAGVSFAKYASEDDALRELTYWMMGSMSEGKLYSVALLTPALVLVFAYMEWLAPRINVLGAGDDVASSLGINVRRIRNTGLVASAVITSLIIAFTGVIGFIGLMAPHICRMLIGNDTRYLLPASGLVGAIILLISYIASLNVISGQVLPVGIFMDVLGGVFFIWLIARRRKEVSI